MTTESNQDRPLKVTVTLQPDEVKGLQKLCDYEGRSKNSLFRWLLLREMRSHEVFQAAERN